MFMNFPSTSLTAQKFAFFIYNKDLFMVHSHLLQRWSQLFMNFPYNCNVVNIVFA